jgi:arsenite-transporting ATPase
LFFTGKGGVGKTSVACATAVKLADAGKKVLLVSTDPASNLDEVLGVTLGNHPTAIPAIPTLFAMNLDPEKSAAEYRERMVGPYRGLLPEAAVKSMEEQFSGSCTLEIAAFDEFSRLLGDPTATAEFDHVIFDTAPTGHTLRLLTLPSAWDGFMEQNTTGTSCLGPLAGLQAQQKLYQESVKALGDPAVTTLVLVARAEASALREAARTSGELAELGVRNQHLVINGVFNAIDTSDPYAVALQQRGAAALAATPDSLKAFPQTIVPLSPNGILGIDSLRRLGLTLVELRCVHANASWHEAGRHAGARRWMPLLSDLIDDLVAPGHGVILAMGKGGVGKTTVAAAVAVAIAERGYEVHLSTTDPAAHIAAAMNDERACPTCRSAASIRKWKRPSTLLKCWVKPVQTLTLKAKHFWKKIFDRRAPKRSLSFAPSPMRLLLARTSLWCSIQLPPATRFSCSIRRWPITARSHASRVKCRKPLRTCYHACEIPTSLAC